MEPTTMEASKCLADEAIGFADGVLFNHGWQFLKLPPDAPMPEADEPWLPVTIPHDWLIYDTRHLYEDGDGWYRKCFNLPPEACEGKCIFICFDGVYMDCEVFINGSLVFEWKYGYTAFTVDATHRVKPGDNEIALRVKYRSPNSRWYSGAGIYRDVRMIIKNADHLRIDGLYITPLREDENRWRIELDAEPVVKEGKHFTLTHSISDAAGRVIATGEGGITQTLYIDNPCLWDIDAPHLYTLTTSLYVDGTRADCVTSRFGCRVIMITPDKGFWLNGRRIKLKGVCQHHDLGALGAAVHPDAIKRQFTLLREMGVNAVRTAHNPPARVWMELAADMGFLVLSEILDMWRKPKTKYDYARFFDEWIERDVASWIRRDRNNPAVMMWSVGNEIYDTHAGAEGRETLSLLTGLVRLHDPKNHAPVTLCSNYMPWPNTQACAGDVKLIGYNYAEYLYTRHHEAHPDWIIYGGETGSTVQSRGVYHFPLSQSVLADDDVQCSALGNSATSWGAKNVEACIIADRDADFSLGQFVWTGFDYIGEPTPYTTKNAYFGHLDTAGFKKDSFYLFQSAWTDYKTAPMLHILPYWDFTPGQMIDVRVYTNAPKATLFLNGQSCGTVCIDHQQGRVITGDCHVPYEPGELTALACDETGAVIARSTRRSFGDAYRITLRVTDAEGTEYTSRDNLMPSSGALLFVEITAVDEQDNPVENANNRVNLRVMGAALWGMDNGDSTDYDPYKTDNRRMFNGKLLAIIAPYAPDFAVLAESPGLLPAAWGPGAGRLTCAVKQPRPGDDIPVRKIELISAQGCALHPGQPETLITALLKPIAPAAAYRDLVWRLTDAAGIDSPLAALVVSEDGLSAVVKAKGDGTAYVRCGIKNGGETVAFYSLLALTITGMGKPRLNPYAFVSGGLYHPSNVPMTNGNDRGVATLRDGESHVGYADLDFGRYGSDELTIPLFPLEKEPFPLEVWEGMPDEGGEWLCTALYDKGSIWNTYQDFTIKLPRRLTGVTTLCFVLRQKVHIKGFVFKSYDRAFERLYAAENDGIYGDTFLIDGRHVTQIGNNVSIIYRELDFGETGATRIEIAAASRNQKNSVLLSFTDTEGTEEKVMLEIPGTPEYVRAVFPLGRRVTGLQTLTWIFLPGCEIDLAWFNFTA